MLISQHCKDFIKKNKINELYNFVTCITDLKNPRWRMTKYPHTTQPRVKQDMACRKPDPSKSIGRRQTAWPANSKMAAKTTNMADQNERQITPPVSTHTPHANSR